MKPMRNVAKNIFGAVAGAALVATPMMTANAQEATPANNNVTGASVQTRPYPYMDISSVRPMVALDGVERNSTNRIVITFWASNDPQWDRVWNELEQAADRLYAEGVPVSLYRAADLNNLENDSTISIHSNGEEKAATTVFPRSSDIQNASYEAGVLYAAQLNPQVAALGYGTN